MIKFKEKRIQLYDGDFYTEKKCRNLNIICNCKKNKKCSFEIDSNQTIFNLDSSPVKNLIGSFFDSNLKKETKTKSNDLFYYQNTIDKNVSNHLKILNCDDDDDNDNNDEDDFNYLQLLEYLDEKCDSNHIKHMLNNIYDNFQTFLHTPSRLLSLVNQSLFNGKIENLWLRVSGNCKKYNILRYS